MAKITLLLALLMGVLPTPSRALDPTQSPPPSGQNAAGDISAMTATGAGAPVRRTIAAHFADRVNVKDFGAVGDGKTDDTAAFVAANAAAVLRGAQGYGNRSASLYAPAGHYIVTGFDLGQSVGLKGDGSKSTFLTLKPGSNRSLLRVPPVGNLDGNSFSQVFAYPILTGFLINGQNHSQSSTSYGIEFPDNSSSAYNGTAKMEDVVIIGGKSGGVYIGTNRNWLVASNVVSHSHTGPAYIINGYDHRFIAVDGMGAGSVPSSVVEMRSGGNWIFTGCNFYTSGLNHPTIAISPYVTGFVDFYGSSIDDGDTSLLHIAAPTSRVPRPIRIFGGVLDKTNRSGNSHPYITLNGRMDGDLQIFGTTFDKQGKNPGTYAVFVSDPATRLTLSHALIPADAVSVGITNGINAVQFPGIPLSPRGLPSGSIWSDSKNGHVLRLVP